MRKFTRASATVLLLSGIVIGCSDSDDRVEITDKSEWSNARPVPKMDATSQDRFEFRRASDSGGGDSLDDIAFHWTTPEGWKDVAPTQYRKANLRFGSQDEGECFLSILPGTGGGIGDNANRWRGQMGLDPMSPDEIAALPRKSVLGAESVFVDFEGSFSGMGGEAPKDGYRMVGHLLDFPGVSLYIKMIGPTALVEQELPKFDEWVETLHSGGDGHTHGPTPAVDESEALPPDHPVVDMAMADSPGSGTTSSSQGFSWTAPDSWKQSPPRTMRLVSFSIGEKEETECYISMLGGTAGGSLMNINRWLGQFGNDPLEEEGVASLPKITVMGTEVALVEAQGSFTSMRGEKKENQALLGIAWISETGSMFIKMTGPAAEVEAQKAAFVAFCESIKRDA